MRRAHLLTVLFGVLAAGAVGVAADVLPRRPSHERTWVPEQARLPIVRMDGEQVRIRNIRDFRHSASGPPEVRWIEATYDLCSVERVWFALSPFAPRVKGIAHPFLSFEFADGRTLALSVEARKEVGESYSPLRGLARRYETMIVIGTEEDLLPLRVIAWDDPLYLFPVRITGEARYILRRLLVRAQEIEDLVQHAHEQLHDEPHRAHQRARRNRPPARTTGRCPSRLLAGGGVGARLDRLGTAFRRNKRAHYVNDRIRAAVGSSDFSRAIRARVPADT